MILRVAQVDLIAAGVDAFQDGHADACSSHYSQRNVGGDYKDEECAVASGDDDGDRSTCLTEDDLGVSSDDDARNSCEEDPLAIGSADSSDADDVEEPAHKKVRKEMREPSLDSQCSDVECGPQPGVGAGKAHDDTCSDEDSANRNSFDSDASSCPSKYRRKGARRVGIPKYSNRRCWVTKPPPLPGCDWWFDDMWDTHISGMLSALPAEPSYIPTHHSLCFGTASERWGMKVCGAQMWRDGMS